MMKYEEKFANFIEMCDESTANGVECVVVAHPEALGDDYVEIVESLNRLRQAGLCLLIARQHKLMILPKIKIDIYRSTGDCEDCGSYDDASANLTIPNGQEFQFYHDGHLGGGHWSGNNVSVILWAFQSLGLQILFPEENKEDFRSLEEPIENDYSLGFRTGKYSNLFCGPLFSIPVSFQAKTIHYDSVDWEGNSRPYTYDIHEKAFWTSPDGTKKEFPMDENDQTCELFLLEILKEYAEVSFKEETEPYEPRHYYDDDDWDDYADSGEEPENALQSALKQLEK